MTLISKEIYERNLSFEFNQEWLQATLESINNIIEYHFSNTMGLSSGGYLADAVAEIAKLHKPIRDDWFDVGKAICSECTREEYTVSYPCNTIKSIMITLSDEDSIEKYIGEYDGQEEGINR